MPGSDPTPEELAICGQPGGGRIESQQERFAWAKRHNIPLRPPFPAGPQFPGPFVPEEPPWHAPETPAREQAHALAEQIEINPEQVDTELALQAALQLARSNVDWHAKQIAIQSQSSRRGITGVLREWMEVHESARGEWQRCADLLERALED